MKRKQLWFSAFLFALACLLAPSTLLAQNCQYVQGETKYEDWAKCRYGDDAIVQVPLQESTGWDQCIYMAEAFRPEKLLAVTRDDNGTEVISINDRSQVGNPCYLTKSRCDKALQGMKDRGEY
ncbi:MAG: hypothetical protein ACR2QG_04300 [Gammaproteobacteria bacterium]